MSYQTKKQSIGYILMSYFQLGFTAKQLGEVFGTALDSIRDRTDITNQETMIYFEGVGRTLQLDGELLEKGVDQFYSIFDLITVEEAGEFYSVMYQLI
ncbi:hypothetical protein V7068_19095 [Bacillus sp. JJ634]